MWRSRLQHTCLLHEITHFQRASLTNRLLAETLYGYFMPSLVCSILAATDDLRIGCWVFQVATLSPDHGREACQATAISVDFPETILAQIATCALNL